MSRCRVHMILEMMSEHKDAKEGRQINIHVQCMIS
jgi:hypothetical protein